MLELVGLEDDENIGDRMRPDRRVAEAVDLDRELLAERAAHPFGDGTRLGRVVIDVGVIAQVPYGFRGLLDHLSFLPADLHRRAAFLHSDTGKSIQPTVTPPR